MSKPIRFALIQSGLCVFGTGHTYRDCLRDAAQWLEADEGGAYYTPARIENELLSSDNKYYRCHGGFEVLEAGDPDFDSYLENQGGFRKNRRGNWVLDS